MAKPLALFGRTIKGIHPVRKSGFRPTHLGVKSPKTLNAGFRLTYPLDYEPESGRVDLRCHSARALHAIPHLRSITGHPAKS